MCNCYKEMNQALAEHNTRLVPSVILSACGRAVVRVTIETEKLDSRKRPGPVNLTGSYCPFCGSLVEGDLSSDEQ